MPFAREGHWVLAGLLALALGIGAFVSWLVSIPVWIALLLAAFVFRQPPRSVEAAPLDILSPIDGRIHSVAEANDPIRGRTSRRITLRQNPFGPYIVYAPVEGRLEDVAGTWSVALLIQTDEGDEVVMEFVRSRSLRYLHCHVSAGERLRQGGICGFGGFGRTLHLYIPLSSRIEGVVAGKVRAGQTLARLAPHEVGIQ